jgi:hypothetical protein
LRLIRGIVCACIASSSSADIYQWHDGDENGSLWLSSSLVKPYSNLSLQTLWWADLQNANLEHANLSTSNLSYANLSQANLDHSDLSFSNFHSANLQSANMNNANMFFADFSDANLAGIENWSNAFWLAAKYTQNTIFPDGMNPNDFGMLEVAVPSPGVLFLMSATVVLYRRRR